MGKIRKLMHGVHTGLKRMRAWYHAYKIKKMQNSQAEVKHRETKIMEDIAPTFNHGNPLYAKTEEDVRAAQILKEVGLRKGKAVSYYPDKKKEQKTVYSKTDEDVRAAQILKEAGLRKGKAVCYHDNRSQTPEFNIMTTDHKHQEH
ncbi:hypothetical protein C1H46_014402 [Malus baccata]|uniref:Uncharacterized protein n=1 Tax=Malus baccata TaxID=106549 RepID=A0A540MMK6_MALBA|nr:hypothetical protein C1H46_014402 [Malus baccata]